MMNRYVVIIGSRERNFDDPVVAKRLMLEMCNKLAGDSKDITLISGASPGRGADVWAEEFAEETKRSMLVFPANPPLPQGFHIRNQKMVDSGSEMWAFWAGNTAHSGTLSTVRRMLKAGKPVKLFKIARGVLQEQDVQLLSGRPIQMCLRNSQQ